MKAHTSKWLIRAGILAAALWGIRSVLFPDRQMNIVDYHPSQFVERAEQPFFYSIGKQLKYGWSIDQAAPALFEGARFDGDIVAVYPSPDNRKAAVVSNAKLYLVRIGKPAVQLLDKVDHYAPTAVDVGEVYFKWPNLQWHPDSRFIYIAKDKKQQQLSEQSFSRDASLVRLDTEQPGTMAEVVPDFRALKYFFVGDAEEHSLCYDYAQGDGSVICKCRTPKGIFPARSLDRQGVHLDDGTLLPGRPFLSYRPNIHETAIWMDRYDFTVGQINARQDAVFHRSKPSVPLLYLRAGNNFLKGGRDNALMNYGGAVLPGGRYLLLNMANGQSLGQVLLDRDSGRYRELPKNTRIYRNLNSSDCANFRFNVEDLGQMSFFPCRPQSADPDTPAALGAASAKADQG